MNFLDIIPPDFKLTGTLKLKTVLGIDFALDITTQRRIIPHDFKFDNESKLTLYAQLNIIEKSDIQKFENYIKDIPPIESELLISALGRKDFLDEVCLCVFLNPTLKTSFKDIINSLYRQLVNIINEVMKLTTGSKGSRRHIYQYYFYNSKKPLVGDGVLLGMVGMKLSSLNDYEKTNEQSFKESISNLRKELMGLYNSEDIPLLDLIDLTLDQFNTILKLLPKDTAWLKTRKDRFTFFGEISDDLDKLGDLTDQFALTSKKYKTLMDKHSNSNIRLEELQVLSEMITKGKMSTIPTKIKEFVNKINVFTLMYNANGVLKYKGKTLVQSSSLINDLLNSQFMTFLQTFKSQHKRKLVETIGDNLPKLSTPTKKVEPKPQESPEVDEIKTYILDTHKKLKLFYSKNYGNIKLRNSMRNAALDSKESFREDNIKNYNQIKFDIEDMVPTFNKLLKIYNEKTYPQNLNTTLLEALTIVANLVDFETSETFVEKGIELT
jgi:hypothetical protein